MPAADVQALAEGNHSVTANVTNAVGVAAAEASKAIIYNSTAPLTITLDDTALTAGETTQVTFTFHEAVTWKILTSMILRLKTAPVHRVLSTSDDVE